VQSRGVLAKELQKHLRSGPEGVKLFETSAVRRFV
jgi:hypothetical protein